uniref:Uncharacterized protein LOC114338885 n=1 Tax=Diabrotica virgifera virgifera TaxID=50390 RepID=A0A6P7G8C9_DIAVI
MAFIIPDQILEGLICSFCHKYLSVKPIIVYPNRDVKCGRCVGTEKQHGVGVESLYGKITEKCLFKCINKFDGCRELLSHSQVIDHEKVCLEKTHKCPICYEEMPSLLMIPHFHSNHNDATLDSPAFVFNLNRYSETPGIYIYQEEDNLFFLYISYSKSENTIKLELVYMGNEKLASNILHQFTVTNENKEFDINFTSKPFCANKFSVVDASNMSHLINVKFKVIYKSPTFFTIPENVHSSSIQNSLEKANQNQEVLTITENANPSSSSINNVLENPQPNQGKIQFIFKSSLEFTKETVEFSSEYNPQCFNCKKICIFSLSDSYAPEYYYSPTRNDFLCLCCFEWLTYTKKIKENYLYMKQSISPTLKKRLCKWNCGKYIKFSQIVSHEIFCRKRIHYYNCPVQNCSIRVLAWALTNHLCKCHKSYDSVFVCSTYFLNLSLKSKFMYFIVLEDQIIYFKLQPQSTYQELDMEYKIATNDNTIQSELKPHLLFFYNNKLTPLADLLISDLNFLCTATFVLVKNE